MLHDEIDDLFYDKEDVVADVAAEPETSRLQLRKKIQEGRVLIKKHESKFFHVGRSYRRHGSAELFQSDTVEVDGKLYIDGDEWKAFMHRFQLNDGQSLCFEIDFEEIAAAEGTVTIVLV